MRRFLSFLSMIIISTQTFAQTPVAVADFFANGLSESEVRALTDRFRNELFAYKQFDIMERAYMEDILQEQGFQLSGCTSDECVIEAGRLIGVEEMIGGSISRVGRTYTVAARIISVESGKILKTANYDYTGEIDNLLKNGMKHIAAQLAGFDPSVQTEKFGKLSINSNIPMARIYINNQMRGYSGLEDYKLKSNSYNISLKHQYFLAKDTVINIANKENKILNLRLLPDREKILTDRADFFKKRNTFMIASAVSFGIAGYFLYSAQEQYDDYATAWHDATDIHQQIRRDDIIWQVSTGAGILMMIPVIKYHLNIKKLNNLLSMEADYKTNHFNLSLKVKI